MQSQSAEKRHLILLVSVALNFIINFKSTSVEMEDNLNHTAVIISTMK